MSTEAIDPAITTFVAQTRSNLFRFNCKRAFLTYPQVSADIDIADILINVKQLPHYESCIIAKELHADGNPHIHILLCLSKAPDWTNSRKLDDLVGKHGNYRGIRSFRKCYDYVRKGGNFLEDNFDLGRYTKTTTSKDDLYRSISQSTGVAEGLKTLLEQDPKEYFTRGTTVKTMLEYLHGKPKPNYTPHAELNGTYAIPQEITDWLESDFRPVSRDRRRCLILVGPTRLGKTSWARSLDPCHIFMRGSVNLDKFHPAAKHIIIDDVPWQFIPNKKQWLLAMGECEFTDKYRPKQTIINDKPAIVLLNDKPDFADEYEYWSNNSVLVEITEPLFNNQ